MGTTGSSGDATSTPPDEPGVTVIAKPSRRAAIIRTTLVFGILFVVFGIILPRFVDYADVIAAFKALTLPQLVLITAATMVAWLVSGLMFTVLVPGLRLRRGTEGYVILSGIGASVPMGPWNMAVLWIVMRGWGITREAATSGIAAYGVLNTLTRLATPMLAIIGLAISGTGTGDGGAALVIAGIATVALVLACGLIVAIVRSDRTADAVANTLQRITRSIATRLHRGVPDVTVGVRAFRNEIGALVKRRGLGAMVVGTIGQLTWCLVLVLALRIVGISSDLLTAGDVLAVFALTSVITIIPLAPGGAGIPELLYIAGLTAIAGPSQESLITAGVMLFRLFQWFLPIPVSWILLKVTRKGQPVLPSASELRTYALDAPG